MPKGQIGRLPQRRRRGGAPAARRPRRRERPAGQIVADGPCHEVLADDEVLAARDVELPAGFDLAAIARRPRPLAAPLAQR